MNDCTPSPHTGHRPRPTHNRSVWCVTSGRLCPPGATKATSKSRQRSHILSLLVAIQCYPELLPKQTGLGEFIDDVGDLRYPAVKCYRYSSVHRYWRCAITRASSVDATYGEQSGDCQVTASWSMEKGLQSDRRRRSLRALSPAVKCTTHNCPQMVVGR